VPTLKGSNVNPSVVEDSFERVEIRKEGVEYEIKALSDRLSHWRAFKSSRVFNLASELADPMIFHLNCELAKSATEFPDLPLDKVEEYRAECRGELRAWHVLKYGPDLWERRLKELEKLLDSEQKTDKKKIPQRLVEKYS
jgi:hypothetical protein